MDNDEVRGDQPTISPDDQPSRWETIRGEEWFTWLVRGIIAVIVILVIVFGGRWLHHRLSHKSTPATTTTRPAFPDNSNTQTGKNNAGSSSSGSTKKPSNSSSSNSNQATNNPSLKSGQQLSNTGPGDVVAIFLGASFLFASLHYAYESRKNS